MYTKQILKITCVTILLVCAMMFIMAGCQKKDNKDAIDNSSMEETESSIVEKGGAQLWSENCMRCHNMRSPSSYSDAQWDVATHHMRVRANLTATEHEKIVEFLKSSN